MNERKRAHKKRHGSRAGSPAPQAAARPDPGNTYLEGLIRECYSGRVPATRMRRRAVTRLDEILDDPRTLEQLTGRGMEEFARTRGALSDAMSRDTSRPVFRDDPRCMCDERTGLEMGHLLLLLLLDLRGGSVRDGMAAIFDMDPGTAEECLEYGMRALEKASDTPEKLAAAMLDLLRKGRYDEVELKAPDLTLLVMLRDIPSGPSAGMPQDTGPVRLLFILTAARLVIGSWSAPRDRTSRTNFFRRYLEGEGAYLKELTRPLPDGRRWKIRHTTGLGGIAELLPGADVGPLYEPKAGAPAARSAKPGSIRPRNSRQAAAVEQIQKIFPEADIVPPARRGAPRKGAR